MRPSRPHGALSIALPLYLVLATAVGFVDFRMRVDVEHAYTAYVPGILANTEGPPGKYRVLAPYAYAGFSSLTGLAPRESWVLFRWLSLFACLLAMHWYLRNWFADRIAIVGNLLMSCLLLLTFTNGWAHPDHLFELCLFTLGCATIARRQWLATAVVLALATANRETAAFLGLLYFVSQPASRGQAARTGVLAATWLAVWGGLRLWRGWESYNPWQLDNNLKFFQLMDPIWDPYKRAFAWFVVMLAVPLLVIILRSWKLQPRFTRMAAFVVAPVFFVVAMLFTSVIETRVFTPLLPLLIPGVLIAVFPDELNLSRGERVA